MRGTSQNKLVMVFAAGMALVSIVWMVSEGLISDAPRQAPPVADRETVQVAKTLSAVEALSALVQSATSKDSSVWEPQLLDLLKSTKTQANLFLTQTSPGDDSMREWAESILELERETRHRLILQGPGEAVLAFVTEQSSKAIADLAALSTIREPSTEPTLDADGPKPIELATGLLVIAGVVFAFACFRSVRSTANADELESSVASAGLMHLGDLERSQRDVREELEISINRLEAILENVPSAIYLQDLEGDLLLANSHFERMFGVPGAQVKDGPKDAAGEGVYAVWLDEQAKRMNLEVLSTGRPASVQLRLKNCGRAVHRTKFPVRDVSGSITGIGTVDLDITEQLNAADALLLAKDAAEKATRAKSDFLANMSHEIRTPLNAILGFSDILKGELFGPIGNSKYQGYVEDIHKSGQYLMDLLGDILDLSKVEAGKYELEEDSVPVAEMISDCTKISAAAALRKSIELTEEVETEIAVRGDRRAIRQIILNLLSNAIKFTPEGGAVRIVWQGNAETGAELSISDSGIGIASSDLKRVTNPFTQVSRPSLSDQPGTGIGLSLTKELVRLHGASMQIESEIDVGTLVRITFPKERILSTL